MATYLGFDSSTQSLTATVIEVTGTGRRILSAAAPSGLKRAGLLYLLLYRC